jgi:hypothetical protein
MKHKNINVEIQPLKLAELGISIEQWIILNFIYLGEQDLLNELVKKQYISLEELKILEEKYIKLLDYEQYGSVAELRQEGKNLFVSEKNLNFDEFFEAFPVKTSDGRVLRTSQKLNGVGDETEGYKRAKKLYLQKVKGQKEHEFAVNVVKARANSGDTKYMNNIETYIRQKVWEADQAKYKDGNSEWDRNIANQ